MTKIITRDSRIASITVSDLASEAIAFFLAKNFASRQDVQLELQEADSDEPSISFHDGNGHEMWLTDAEKANEDGELALETIALDCFNKHELNPFVRESDQHYVILTVQEARVRGLYGRTNWHVPLAEQVGYGDDEFILDMAM